MSDSPPVLDPCCGSRMFWFDRSDPRALFGDVRAEKHRLTDKSSAGGARELIVAPDMLMDFRALPFPNDTFHLVVFDPPHLISNGKSGWLAKKYGTLGNDWRDDIRAGFAECFRVLKSGGTLIFKWNEHEIRVAELLALTDQKPLFGNRCGKTAKSHWIVFMKPCAQVARMTPPITWTQQYEGGRIVATMGSVEIGAVFPPVGQPRDSLPWVSRFWLNGLRTTAADGRAKTELAAKNAVIGHMRDWMRAAGLEQENVNG